MNYEDRGLIKPDIKDSVTGNRYYTIDTFTQLRTIRNFQDLGLSLDEIRSYFDDSSDLTPLIQRLEEMRDQLNLSIAKLYERSKSISEQVQKILVEPQLVYRCIYPGASIAERTVLLRTVALEAMHTYGTDITRRMYFTEYQIDQPLEVAFCASVPSGSQGEFVELLPSEQAICIYHHGAYESLPQTVQKLLSYAKEHGLTPKGRMRHVYLEGPPQHKDKNKFITQVIMPLLEK